MEMQIHGLTGSEALRAARQFVLQQASGDSDGH